jgi:hypothetical protein
MVLSPLLRCSGGKIFFADLDVSYARDPLSALAIHVFVARLDGVEAVDVAVEHAEGGGDQDGVVDLEVC